MFASLFNRHYNTWLRFYWCCSYPRRVLPWSWNSARINGQFASLVSRVLDESRLYLSNLISYGHEPWSNNSEKSWNLKVHFPGLEKSWILGGNGRSHGKGTEFHFLVQIFRAVWKLETFSLSSSKVYLKKAGSSVFLSHGKFIEKLSNFTAKFLFAPCTHFHTTTWTAGIQYWYLLKVKIIFKPLSDDVINSASLNLFKSKR